MLNLVSKFIKDDSGASAAEYALILAIVGVGIAVAAGALGTSIKDTINKSAACISGTTTGGQTCPT